MKTDGGRELFRELSKKFSNGKKGDTGPAFELNQDMMRMLGGFTLVRFLGMAEMMNVSFTKDELLDINKRLNKIRRS